MKRHIQKTTLHLSLLLIFLLIGPGCQPARSNNQTYYAAVNGSDANPGTESSPWRTIQHAADTVGPGDTVLVRGGVYEEAVTINVSGSENNVITFQSYPGETAVLDGSNLTVPAADNGLFLIDSQNYITISGFELRHYRTADPNRVPSGIYITGSAHHIQLRHNSIHHIETNAGPNGNAHGIAVYGSQAPASIHDILIDGNELRDLKLGSSESLVLNGNVEQFTVSNNLVHDNDNIGIDLIGYEGVAPDPAYDRARDSVIRQNTVYNIDSGSNPAYFGEQSADGIYVDGGTRLLIEGNRVYQNNIGIEIASEHSGRDTSYVTVRNNLIYRNHIAGIAMGGYDRQRGSSHHNAILNNTLYQNNANHNGSGEIMLQFDTSDNVIQNNIIAANDQALLISNPFTENNRNMVDYNLYFSPAGPDDSEWQWKNIAYQGFAAYRSATGNDAHSLFADPQFVDETALNFHLQASSPAVDAGDNAADSGDADFAGNARRQNGAIDLGALEFTAVSPAIYLPAIVTPTPTNGKWALWHNGTQLRGANIFQRRVYPELDGPTFMGPGPLGPPYVQQDFDDLAALGANYVNISHPGLFSETPPYVLDEDAQANLDNLLAMIAQADMFAVISFRTGPGRSDFTFYWDEAGDWFDAGYLNDTVWQDQAAQEAWAEMWQYTAARYRDNPIVVGYDLMVEPNANEVGADALNAPLNVWDPAEFYDQYGGSLYDWNQMYPAVSDAIRAADSDTPILIGGMGYSAADWLPYLTPTGDPRTVYTIHQYAPAKYTHQDPGGADCPAYPGQCDVDWDDVNEQFDRAWLDEYLTAVDNFQSEHNAPVAANEYGLMRWEPDAAAFMQDQMELFEARGMNYALWAWEPAWPEWAAEVDAFNFRHGPAPNNHDNVPNDLEDVIRAAWAQNTVRPSTFAIPETAVPLPAIAAPAAQSPISQSPPPPWQRANPGGGGAFTAAAAGPTGILLVASDLSGAYRSLDGGQTWDVIGSYRGLTSTHVVSIGFSPSDPAVIFLGTDEGIFRSGDGGDTFSRVLADGYVSAVAVSPADPQIVYAARHSAWNVSDGRLYQSADNGRTWQPVSSSTLPDGLSILKLQLHPGDADTLYLLAGEARFTCGPAAAYRSADGGATWTEIGGGLGQVMDLALDETAPNTLFLTTYGDVWDPGYNCISDDPNGGYLYQSDDDGDTWTQLTTTQRNALIWLDNDDDLAIRLIDLDARELWESPDGNDWTLVSDISEWDDGWPENSFTYGSSFNGDAMTIGVDMSDPDALFWVDGQFVYGTRDDGRTFANLYTNEIAPGRWQSRGIDNIVTFDLVISPADSDVIYLAMPDAGCFRSEDGGAGWQNCNPAAYTGSWNGAGGNVMTAAADPARANVVWLTQAEDVADGPHTLLRSDDFGATWTASHDGLPASGVPAGLSVDPASPTGSRTLFITFGGNVYRSQDDGRTWSQVLACGGCRYTAVSPHDSAIVFAGGEAGLWRSLDGGDSWTETGLPEMRGSLGGEFWDKYWEGVAAIVFDPVDAARVYTAVFGADRGLYRSDDGGNSWERILADDFLRDTAVSPAAPQTIYAASAGAIYSGGYEPDSQGFLVSRDGGQSWQAANEGLAWPFVNVITLDPNDPDTVFIGSPGAGYHHRDFSPELSYQLHLPVITAQTRQITAAAKMPRLLQ